MLKNIIQYSLKWAEKRGQKVKKVRKIFWMLKKVCIFAKERLRGTDNCSIKVLLTLKFYL